MYRYDTIISFDRISARSRRAEAGAAGGKGRCQGGATVGSFVFEAWRIKAKLS
jgi:hypothetical protein